MSNSLIALSKVPSNQLASRMGAIVRDMRIAYGNSQREGQLLMNALNVVDPELAHMVTHQYPEADCFFDDGKIPAFLELMFPRGMA